MSSQAMFRRVRQSARRLRLPGLLTIVALLTAFLTPVAVAPSAVAAPRKASPAAVTAAKVRAAAVAQPAPTQPAPVVTPPGGFPAGVSVTQELTSERTADSRTYLTSTGKYLTMDYEAPIDYQDQTGAWQAINPSLVGSTLSGYAWHDSANAVDVELPSSLGTQPVLVSNGADWVSLELQGAAAAGSVSADTATYDDAVPGVTVSYTSEDNELKESMVLSSSSAPSSFTYGVDLAPGDSLASDGSGGLELVGTRGQVMFDLPAATMSDAAGADGGAVSMTAADGESGWTITVAADPSWLQDPARVWPVTIDPSVTFNSASYCTLNFSAPNTSACNGSTYTVSSVKNAVMEFPGVESTVGAASLVESAQLYLNETAANGSATVNLGAYGLNESWNNTATWNDRNTGTAWQTAGGTYDSTATDSESEAVTPTSQITWTFNVQSLVQAWVSGRIDDGLAIHEASGESTGLTFAGSGTEPYLAITYEDRLGNEPFYNVSKHTIDDQETLGINAANGNAIIDTTDYTVSGTGLSMQVQRTYNAESKRSGSLGLGWSLNMGPDVSLTAQPGGAYLLYDRNGANWLFTAASGGGWTPPAGINATLQVQGSGMLLTYDASQEKLFFVSPGESCSGLALSTDTDRNQNILTYTYSACDLYAITLNRAGETLAQGRLWSVATNTHNEITGITESNFDGGLNASGTPIARSVGFGYDPTNTYLTSYTDANGQVTSYGYDSSGRLDQITNPDGHIITLTYNGSNRASTVTYITNLSSMVGDTTTYTYRANLLTANENSLASGTTSGWLQSTAASIAAVTSPVYAGSYSLAATAGASGSMQVQTSGTAGAALPVEPGQSYQGAVYVRAQANTASVQAQLLWYNAAGTLLSSSTSSGSTMTDSSTSWTQYTVGGSGPDGGTAATNASYVALSVSFTGTSAGDVHYLDLAWLNPGTIFMAQNTPEGLPYVMGAACGSGANPLASTMPASVWALAVNTQLDPNGNTTTYCYDGRDEVTTAIDGLGRGRQTSYTANSDVSTSTDAMPTPGVTTSSYYSQNQPDQIQAPNTATGGAGSGRTESLGDYGSSAPTAWLPGTATDTQGNESAMHYDGAGNLNTVTNADGNKATVDHNSDGTVSDQSGAGGSCTGTTSNCTTYSYTYATTDPTVLQTMTTNLPSPLGDVVASYDSGGRLSSTVDGKSQKTVYCYDNDDRPTKVFYDVTVAINCGTTTSPQPGITYSYDGDGNLTQRVDNSSSTTTTYGYDNLDRVLTELQDTSPVCSVTLPGSSITYHGDACLSYDPNSNVQLYDDAGGPVTYNYDAANQNTAVNEPGSGGGCSVSLDGTSKVTAAGCTAFAYDNNGVREQTLYPSGELVTDTPDTSNRIASITSKLGGTTIDHLAYTYVSSGGADSGLLRTKTDYVAGTTTTYGYNGENQLCWAATQTGTSSTVTTSGCTPPVNDELSVQSYTYDTFGNMTSQTAPNGTVTTYANNNADQLCWSVTGTTTDTCSTGTPTDATTYTFDMNGNQTASQPPSATGFAGNYNAANQTTSLTNDSGGGSTSFVYADAGQSDRLSAGSTNFFNSFSGVASASYGGHTYYYTRDANGTVIGMRQGSGSTSTNYYYTTDNLGSVIAMNSATGATDATYTYDPYGNATIGTDVSGLANTNPWRFDGGWWDNGEQMYHFGARYYDPAIARWTQLDPSGKGSGYSFASGDPVNATDSSGECPVAPGQYGPPSPEGCTVGIGVGFSNFAEVYLPDDAAISVTLSNPNISAVGFKVETNLGSEQIVSIPPFGQQTITLLPAVGQEGADVLIYPETKGGGFSYSAYASGYCDVTCTEDNPYTDPQIVLAY